MDLRDYEHAKFELAELLREAVALGRDSSADARTGFQELFARLAEDRFNLVVVGRFSRGKTSLMNALIGIDRLPVGIVPLTSVITTVSYGSAEAAVIRYKEHRLDDTIPLDALPQYITQRHNPGNVRGVLEADIRLPSELLRRGFHFVDTPGLGSPIIENTRTTEQFVPEADAFVLVTSYESPLSAEEFEVLRSAVMTARRVFVVINKQDTVSHAERDEALGYVRERLAELREGGIPVYSVSARDGLAARQSGDAARLAASGILLLETDLTRFLLEDKQREFLLRFIDRAAPFLPAVVHDVAGASRIAGRLAVIAERIGGGDRDRGPRRTGITPSPIDAGMIGSLEACAICRQIVAANFEFLRHFQYELNVNPEAQRQLAREGGFCALHAWQYATLATVHGVCTGYAAVLEGFSQALRTRASTPISPRSWPAGLRVLLPARQHCPACSVQAKAESGAVERIADELGKDARSLSNSRSVICLPHLCVLLDRLDDPDLMEMIVLREASILDRLAEDMRRYATKHDALRRHLASAEEESAGKRAIEAVAGLRNTNIAPMPL